MKTIFNNDPPDFTKQEAAEQIQRVFHKKENYKNSTVTEIKIFYNKKSEILIENL